jgi:hypothetical protein
MEKQGGKKKKKNGGMYWKEVVITNIHKRS